MPFDQKAASELEAVRQSLKSQVINFTQAVDFTRVKDKGILLTGGASGLGKAIALACARHGAFVTIADLSEQTGKQTEQEAQVAGHRLQFVQCDVTNWSSQVEAFRAALRFHPSLDHVVASAGVVGPKLDMTPDTLEAEKPAEPHLGAIEVSLRGSYFTIQLAVKCMARSSDVKDVSRSITLVASQAGYRGIVGRPDYCGAKFGIRGMFKSLRPDLRSAGIRINMLAPSYIRTPLTEPNIEYINSQGYTWGKIDDVEHAALMLMCSERIHGRSVSVDRDGLRDMRDDPEGMDGGLAMVDHLEAGLSPLFCA